MKLPVIIAAGALVLTLAQTVRAEGCKLSIEGNDLMQYSVRELSVPSSCTEVELTLKHAGHLDAKVMGHDWVLAKASDVSAIVNAGMASGLAHGYLPAGDKRILASTKIVGGGESATVTFSTAALQPDVSYAFFCTTPGHATIMRGKFLFGADKRMAQVGK